MDKDNDGAIDFNEFVAGLKYLSWVVGNSSKRSYNYVKVMSAIGLSISFIAAATILYRRLK